MKSNNEILSVGSRIKLRREHAGLSQAELAAKVGVSASMLSLWENNKRPLENIELIKKFSDALNTTVSWMIGNIFGILSAPDVMDGYPVLKSVNVLNMENYLNNPVQDDGSILDLDYSERFGADDSSYSLNGLYQYPACAHSLPLVAKFVARSENIHDYFDCSALPEFGDDLIFGYVMPDDFLSDSYDHRINIYQGDYVFFSLLSKVYPGQLCIVGLKSGDTLVGRFNPCPESQVFFIESFKNDPIKISVNRSEYDFVFRIIYSQPLGRKR